MGSHAFFTPKAASTLTLTCAVASSTLSMQNPGGSAQSLRIHNSDPTNTAYVEVSPNSTVTAIVPTSATLGSMPVGPNETLALSIPETTLYVAGICTAGTPAVQFTMGNGQSR